MVENILLFTGFVSGYGGAIKASRIYGALKEKGENPLIVTEVSYIPKLKKFGLTPDLVIECGSSPESSHQRTKQVLDAADYKTMISFGPRTFGPRHAVENNKPVIIVDGGLPSFLGQLNTDHEGEVYAQASLYALTCHFPWEIQADIAEKYKNIPIEVLSQPLDRKTEEQFGDLITNGTNATKSVRKKFSLDGRKSIFIQMGYSLFDENNLESNGSWLKFCEYEQARKFVGTLLETLPQTGEHPLVFLDARISAKFESRVYRKGIEVIAFDHLPVDESIALSRTVDLNVNRAMRNVTQFQISATGGYSVVCPCPTNYMHEDVASEDAEKMGIIKNVPFDKDNLGQILLEYIGSEHYHSSREKRIECWNQMHSERNLLDRILEVHRLNN